jgi:hypothetical protein
VCDGVVSSHVVQVRVRRLAVMNTVMTLRVP